MTHDYYFRMLLFLHSTNTNCAQTMSRLRSLTFTQCTSNTLCKSFHMHVLVFSLCDRSKRQLTLQLLWSRSLTFRKFYFILYSSGSSYNSHIVSIILLVTGFSPWIFRCCQTATKLLSSLLSFSILRTRINLPVI